MLKQKHQFTIQELDEMLPWEREVYIALIREEIERQQSEGS